VKAKWIDEVTEIISSGTFASWFEQLEGARNTLARAGERYDELLTQVNLLEFRAELAHRKAIDVLERATSLEDESAELANSAAELENASFEVVSQFELQRSKCTALWEQLGAIDMKIEDKDGDRAKLERERAKLTEQYERDDQRKQRLWSEVEKLWVRSIDCNLALREKQHKAKLVRADAEKLFLKHEEEATQASKLRAEAEKTSLERGRAERAVVESQEVARNDFEALLSEDFLYWVARESNKKVYAVSLIDDAENYLVPVSHGQIFLCSPTMGIEKLVPVEKAEDVDAEISGPGPLGPRGDVKPSKS
jgi:chromosome segregation ATPase